MRFSTVFMVFSTALDVTAPSVFAGGQAAATVSRTFVRVAAGRHA